MANTGPREIHFLRSLTSVSASKFATPRPDITYGAQAPAGVRYTGVRNVVIDGAGVGRARIGADGIDNNLLVVDLDPGAATKRYRQEHRQDEGSSRFTGPFERYHLAD